MAKKNILLVYPEIRPKDTYWSMRHALSFIGKKSSMPPLGLVTIAAMMPDEDYNFKLVDMNIRSLRDNDIRWADAVFTSSMVIQKDSLFEVVRRANEFGVPVVAGGPYPTQYFAQIEQQQGIRIDHYVLGEAESGVLDSFLSDWQSGAPKRVYFRTTLRLRHDERQIDQESLDALVAAFKDEPTDIQVSAERPSMNVSPIPRFDLLEINRYGSMIVQYSRGCPNICEFCDVIALFGHNMRGKSPERMIAELQALYDTGYRGNVFFADDNFIGNKKAVKTVLSQITEFQQKKRFPFIMYTESDITLATDKELMALMHDAGFRTVFIGLESPDKEVLRKMGKHHNVRIDLNEAVRTIQQNGIEVTAGFIIGNDDDPKDIFDRIYRFCQQSGVVTSMVGRLVAIKDSLLYARLTKEGRLLKEFSGNNTHHTEMNFIPLEAVKSALERKVEAGSREYRRIVDNVFEKINSGYNALLRRLYDSNMHNYFERTLVLFDQLSKSKGKKGVKRPFYEQARAVAISLLKYHPLKPRGWQYWKFLSRVVVKYPKLLPQAVEKGVEGYHFMKVTRSASY